MIIRLKDNRVLRSYLGGKKISEFLNQAGEDGYYPEDWTASVVKALNPGSNDSNEGLGYLENGLMVKDVMKGEMRCLVKLLNASERLVIQVHPTRQFAEEYFNSKYGKTECWYFLNCEENAYVYLGFKKGITPEKWKEAFEKQDSSLMLSLLNKVPVKKGDCIFVDGGVPHAIGEGCFMIEVQEPSDLMGVVERHTVSGRELCDLKMHGGIGYENMLKMFSYQGYTLEEVIEKYNVKPQKVSDNVYSYLDKRYTDKFNLLQIKKSMNYEVLVKNGVLIVTSGKGVINGLEVQKGDRFFIDDCTGLHSEGEENFEAVLCY